MCSHVMRFRSDVHTFFVAFSLSLSLSHTLSLPLSLSFSCSLSSTSFDSISKSHIYPLRRSTEHTFSRIIFISFASVFIRNYFMLFSNPFNSLMLVFYGYLIFIFEITSTLLPATTSTVNWDKIEVLSTIYFIVRGRKKKIEYCTRFNSLFCSIFYVFIFFFFILFIAEGKIRIFVD